MTRLSTALPLGPNSELHKDVREESHWVEVLEGDDGIGAVGPEYVLIVG